MLAGILTDFKDALVSGMSGSSRPTNLQAGGVWVDTSNQSAPNYSWIFKIYAGGVDTEIFRISILNGFGGTLTADGDFEIDNVSASTVGPILHMVKQRLINNGQVLDGDSVAQIKFTGRTITSTDPTLAYIKFDSSDDETVTASGGSLTMYSTPDGSATIAEHLRLIAGFVESVAPHKVNAIQPVSQNVATAATIAQLSATNSAVEMTGVTATDIQGISSTGNAKIISIHNRSTAVVTLKHQNTSATAADRLILPNSVDAEIYPQETYQLFYSTGDTRWKTLSTGHKKRNINVERVAGAYQQWTPPAGCYSVKVLSYGYPYNRTSFDRFLDHYGNMYTMGDNTLGQLGDGTVVSKSSPIAVIGGLQFVPVASYKTNGDLQSTCITLSTTGQAYGFGVNSDGQLGVGDVTLRSSPVAVIGGLRFTNIISDGLSVFGITPNGSLYAWGVNADGQLGVGDVASRSSPVAVLGGLKFATVSVLPRGGASGRASVFAITKTGAAYAWGDNGSGQLGVGDVTPRSSPVAVLGSLAFKKIVGTLINNASQCVLGLTSTGAAYAWGNNVNGQIGDGTVVAKSSPVAVLGGLTFFDVDAVSQSMFGLTTTGLAYAWGINAIGQLGVGDVIPRSSPVAVLGGLTFARIIPGKVESVRAIFALTKDGVAYGWGLNVSGILGIGDSTNRSSPVAVLGGLKWDWLSVAALMRGITNDGVCYAWGSNGLKGQMGVGDTVNRSSPVAVLGGFGGMTNAPIYEASISVTPGVAIDVVLSQAQSTFGSTPIGNAVEQITIEYEV